MINLHRFTSFLSLFLVFCNYTIAQVNIDTTQFFDVNKADAYFQNDFMRISAYSQSPLVYSAEPLYRNGSIYDDVRLFFYFRHIEERNEAGEIVASFNYTSPMTYSYAEDMYQGARRHRFITKTKVNSADITIYTAYYDSEIEFSFDFENKNDSIKLPHDKRSMKLTVASNGWPFKNPKNRLSFASGYAVTISDRLDPTELEVATENFEYSVHWKSIYPGEFLIEADFVNFAAINGTHFSPVTDLVLSKGLTYCNMTGYETLCHVTHNRFDILTHGDVVYDPDLIIVLDKNIYGQKKNGTADERAAYQRSMTITYASIGILCAVSVVVVIICVYYWMFMRHTGNSKVPTLGAGMVPPKKKHKTKFRITPRQMFRPDDATLLKAPPRAAKNKSIEDS